MEIPSLPVSNLSNDSNKINNAFGPTIFSFFFCEMTGPTGEIVAEADDKTEAVLVAKFDLEKIKSKRQSWGVFRDRRPDLYKVLLTMDGNL